MDRTEDRVELGRLNGAWGTAGWVKVFSLTHPPENIFDYQPWRIATSPGLLRVRQWRHQGPRLVAQLADVDTRDGAEALRGTILFIERRDLPPIGGDDWYWHDLIGLAVVNRDGRHLGTVRGLLDAGVHDVLEIKRGGAQPDLLVPFVPGHYVDQVDPASGRIVVDWQPEWTDAD